MLAVSLVWVCVSLLFVKTDGNHRTIEKERYAERERERERESRDNSADISSLIIDYTVLE